VGGCVAIGPPRTPSSALAAYAEALAEGDGAAAHALLTPEDQARVSPEEFARALRDNAPEAKELARRLEHSAKPRITAIVLLDDGSELRLERAERGGFRVVDPLTRFYAQASPREALVSFIRAVERKRWDVVLALMPEAERAGLDPAQLGKLLEARNEELSRLVALLSIARDNPIEVVGDRATMPYAESYTARFLREQGRWKIEDPE
jgi:hypothetical protein